MSTYFKSTVLCVILAYVYANEAVLTLTQSTFAETIAANPSGIMVEFYAPWCGHCKQLAPEYESAASLLEGTAVLAKVDCTEEDELCGQFDVKGFPTLKWFTKGVPVDYPQARTADALVSFIENRMGPAATEVSDYEGFIASKSGLRLIAGLPANDADALAGFLELADTLRDSFTIGYTTDDSVASAAGIFDGKGLALIRRSGEVAVFDGSLSDTDAVVDFIFTEQFELVGEISGENYEEYQTRGLPMLWMFVAPEETSGESATLDAARAIAADFKGKASFVFLDGERFLQYREAVGCAGDLPRIMLEETPSKFLFKDESVTSEGLSNFVASALAGDIEPFVKTEEVPEDNSAPVTVVVGSTFNDIVFDESKSVLVEFYAPWCGHCKTLAPIYDSLGEHFKDNSEIVIAKIDATANDAPYPVQGFPTLVYFGAGADAKEAPEVYSGARELQDMVDFILSKTTGDNVEDVTKDEL